MQDSRLSSKTRPRTSFRSALAFTLPILAAAAPRIAYADPEPVPAAPAAPSPQAPVSPRITEVPYPHARPAKDLVTFQIEDADLNELLKAMSDLTGKKFIVGTAKSRTFKASIISPEKISVDEAFRAFLAALDANGLTVIPDGAFLRVVDAPDAATKGAPIAREGEIVAPDDRFVTRVLHVHHVSADDAAALVGKFSSKDASVVPYAPGGLLFVTDAGRNVRRVSEILEEVDVAVPDAKLWLQPLAHVPAAQVEKTLDDVLGLKKASDAQSATPFRIVAIDRPNALAIVASEESYRHVLEVIEEIDVAPPNDTEIHVVPLANADAKKIVGSISEAIGTLGQAPTGSNARGATSAVPVAALDGPARVAADETTNALIVTASTRDFAQIKHVIDDLDKPKRQVFIEAIVMDVSATRGFDWSVAWHGGNAADNGTTEYGGFRSATSALSPSATDLQAFALGIRGPTIPFANVIPGVTEIPGLGAFVTAMATSQGADILSTPSVMASDNTPASLRVQLKTSLQPNAPSPATILAGGATTATSGALNTSSVAQSYQPIGPKIQVTPHLNDTNDDVRLDVEELISDIQSQPDKSETYGTITFLEREAKTTFTVKDGETSVIAGLVRNRKTRTQTKVPLLGDIPLLGALFRTSSDTDEKSNLVLVLTPHIIRNSADRRRIYEDKMAERQAMIDHEALFAGNGWTPPADYSHTRGALFSMRSASREVEEQKKLDADAMRPPDHHDPVAPIDLPVSVPRTWSTPGTPVSAPQRPNADTSTPPASGTTNALSPASARIRVETVER